MLGRRRYLPRCAKEQLLAWGERNNVTVISQESGDSAAGDFDAINTARARNIDVVLADTAGRLPTQLNLMEEIKKVKRVIQKADLAAHTRYCWFSMPTPVRMR